ncbi:uncharacterized protein [Haliotis asinina]|uniref:uncharacterized protein n=1 Tax=Haliotis asinina TaxID=109174 RepID=UPI003531CFF2
MDAKDNEEAKDVAHPSFLGADTTSPTQVPTASTSLSKQTTASSKYQNETLSSTQMNMERTMAHPSHRKTTRAMGSEVARSSGARFPEDEALMITVDSSPGSCVAKEIHVHHHEVDNTILDNMKARSKSTLNDFNMATFHPTKAVQAAREKLHYGYVCLEGKPKSGKSSIGLYLLATFGDKNYTPLILNNPDEYSHISQREKTVVLIDDIFGSRVFMPEMVIRWNKVLQNMYHAKSRGRTFLIITSENGFLDRSHAFVSFDDFLDKTHRVQLQNPDLLLRDFEKFAILEKLASSKRLTQDCKLLAPVVNASNHPWFFDCCKYLSKKKLPLKDWAMFFRHPLAVLCEHIAKLDAIKTALLILIMKHSHIKDSDFSSPTDADFSSPTDGQRDLTASFDILCRIMDLPRGSVLKDVRNAAQSLNGDLVVCRDQHYCFVHDAVRDAVCFTFSKIAPVYFIRWCPLDYLIRHTVTESSESRGALSVKIDSSLFQNLKDRIVQDFTKDFLEHDAFKDEKFVCLFFQNNQVLDDVEHINAMASSCGKRGYAFFLNQILLFIAGFEKEDIEHIKHEALENACSFRQPSVADILLDANAKPCDVCFMKACDGQMLTVVKRCLSTGPPSWSNNLAALVNALRNTDCVTDITAVLLNVTNWNADDRGLAIMASVCETGNWELYHVISESLTDGTLTCRDLLPHAIRGGSLLIVSDLIRKDPNILTVDNGDHESAFFMACRCNKMELVRLIWDEYSITSRSQIYEEGRSSLRALQIAVLASSEDTDLLKWLLDEGFPVNACGGSSRTPLHTACHEGTVGVIRLLLDRQADISAIDADGNTMLHLACGRDDTSKDIIRLLLRSGANVSSLNKENKTPLHVLCEKRHDSRSMVISHLLECEAPVNSMDMHGHTPLHLLLNGGFCLEEVELLIENGTKVGLKDHFQETAIHAACRSSNCNAVKMILENGGVLQARDQHGLSCLHHAVSVMNNGNVVKYLLQCGLQVNTVDTYGNTPLHSAVQVPFNKMVVELLMEMEADSTLTNQEGYAPLHLVCMDSLDYSLEYVSVLKTKSRLLTTKENNTPLHLACMSFGESALSVVKELLDSDANVSERNASGKTALHIVCERSDKPDCSLAQMLCTMNAELDCQDNERNTPLHLACLSEGDSRLHMIEFLINQGANVNIRNGQHLSPVDIIGDRKDERKILMLMINSMLNQACLGNGSYTVEEVKDALSKETDLSLLDKEQRPVLHRICSINGQHSPAIINMLLQQGADIAEKAKDGLTVLHSACMTIGPFTELILETLVRLGGDVNERDDHGQTAFHKACTEPDNHTENVLSKLQQYGIDVNMPDGQGNTPLHLVCSSAGGHIRHRIKWLLEQGADWQYLNHDGHTPHDIANDEMRKVLMNLVLLKYCETSAFFETDVIAEIVQKGADVNCQNNDGNTILHVVSQNHGECAFENISLMVSHGSDKALLNNAGMTAYEVGIDVGLDEAVLQLLCPDEHNGSGPHVEGACGGSEESGKVDIDHFEKVKSSATNFKDLSTQLFDWLSRGIQLEYCHMSMSHRLVTYEPASKSARCLFPEAGSSSPAPTQHPIKKEFMTPEKRVSDIIKQENIDESINSDDSGTDALHVAFEHNSTRSDTSCDSPKPSKTTTQQEAQTVSTPLISEYPPPSVPSYPYGLPQHAFYPMPTPGMFPSVYPGFMPYQAPVYQHLMPQMPPVLQTVASPVVDMHRVQEHYNKVEDNISSHRSPSPASSQASSGVYSDPSPAPSPTRANPSIPSPEISPVAPQRMRAPGGRTCYTQIQVRAMEKTFSESKYPDYEVFEELSLKLDIPVKKIKVWFQNKRARSKCHTPNVSTPRYGYVGPGPMMALPYPVPAPPMMPMYSAYPYPSMFTSPMY